MMAGSYKHIVTDDGNLGSNEYVVDMLENGGDVFETIEEMYGMIWFLAGDRFGILFENADDEKRRIIWATTMKEIVKEAQQEYQKGLELAKEIHKLVPDQRRS